METFLGNFFRVISVGLLLLVPAVASIALYFKWSYTYWKRRGVPYLEPEFLYGNLKDIILRRKCFGEAFSDLYKQLEPHPFGGIFFSIRPTLLIRDPDLIKAVLVKDFAHFQHRGVKVDEENDPMSTNLFNLGGTKWRALRAKLTPTFSSGKMKQMFPLMEECASELQAALQPFADRGEVVDIKEWNARFTTDVIGSCAFGIQCNSLKNPNCEFRAMSKNIFNAIIRGIFNFYLVKLGYLFRVKLVSPAVERFYTDIVRQTVEYRRKNNVSRNDFVQLMMQLQDKGKLDDEAELTELQSHQSHNDGIVLTDKVFAAQCFAFFVAGFETSSTVMTFCAYELATNPDIQVRLRSEIDLVVQRHGGALTYSAVYEMTYLEMVLAETLRKYPPVGHLGRVCTLPYSIPGSNVIVEVGTKINIAVYAIHHDPRYYPEPEKFDPGRFTDEQKAQRHHSTYLPFGDGPKNCIGMRFGLMQAKVGIASLVSRFELVPAPDTPSVLQLDPTTVVTSPVGELHIRLVARPEKIPPKA